MAIGNGKLMNVENVSIPQEVLQYVIIGKSRNTAIFVAVDGKIAGVFSIADQIREDAGEALTTMRKNGIKKMIMLTGDNKHTAQLVAHSLGLDEFHAELLPEDKVDFVKKLKAEGHYSSNGRRWNQRRTSYCYSRYWISYGGRRYRYIHGNCRSSFNGR